MHTWCVCVCSLVNREHLNGASDSPSRFLWAYIMIIFFYMLNSLQHAESEAKRLASELEAVKKSIDAIIRDKDNEMEDGLCKQRARCTFAFTSLFASCYAPANDNSE